jgi:hypothetical protein
MTNKLYVANLPPETTESALRAHFSACGGVLDVEIAADRHSGKQRGTASVTMTSPSFATAALRLNGVDFDGKPLRVSDAPIRAGTREVANVRIVQQFRERTNMTYELECAGVPLTIKMFPQEDERWRFEATGKSAPDAAEPVVLTGWGATRSEALADLVRAWNEGAVVGGAAALDGEGVLTAMRDVRAV